LERQQCGRSVSLPLANRNLADFHDTIDGRPGATVSLREKSKRYAQGCDSVLSDRKASLKKFFSFQKIF
jgi:hypothetical protein